VPSPNDINVPFAAMMENAPNTFDEEREGATRPSLPESAATAPSLCNLSKKEFEVPLIAQVRSRCGAGSIRRSRLTGSLKMLKALPSDTPSCRSCQTGVGMAVGVMASAGVTTVIFRCRLCQHEWNDRRPEPKDPSEKSDAA